MQISWYKEVTRSGPSTFSKSSLVSASQLVNVSNNLRSEITAVTTQATLAISSTPSIYYF